MYITVGRHQWHAPRRLLGGGRTRSLALVLSLSVLSVLVFFVLLPSEWQDVVLPLHRQPAPRRMPVAQPLPPLPDRVPCYGPRRRLLSESPDDELRSAHLDIPYPVPFIGSYDELGLERTWMTPEDRYGPYGYGEEDDDYGRERVSWDAVNWARLQNSCFDRNEARFPAAARWFTNEPRFALRGDSRLPLVRTWDEFNATRRTAIVVRTYNGYRYKPEDMHNLRALVTEASLRTGGEYAVVLLVNIRGPESNVTRSREAYDEAFRKADIPPEFRSIAILWDESLLRSWYPKVEEYR
ncbi:hypothetical protein VTK73DRAFT_658 [Phialemonium thermophilum]|uniref:Uncharacterized protein n=1 Tax=Phialemonium thermophilum TaxID=223376 RepID=A0ABR3VUH2_9PEZI